MRKITYAQAINEATKQLMDRDRQVFIMGQGCTSPWYVGNTTNGLFEKFGEKRVIDTPISENGMSGVALGAALTGLKPILVFPRMDFMYLAFDQIINQAANWRYMFGGKINVPLVIRGIINRGGEQAAQHSQALHSMLAHVPGLKVVMPSTPYDAKGLLISAVEDGNPVVYIDDNWLYKEEAEVPEEIYKVPIGTGEIRRQGEDVTVAAISYMVKQAAEAAEDLEKQGISVEVIDLRSIKPLDEEIILESVKKTKRLVIADVGWKTGGIASEIANRIYSKIYEELKSRIEIVALPDVPAPASQVLEEKLYPNKNNIIEAVKKTIKND
jgi:pyruvate/2-oxoglutarate/acetoin dehydrogenase E1 component